MYRVSPLTYIVSSLASAGIHNKQISCAANEIARFPLPSPSGGTPQGPTSEPLTCSTYLSTYASRAGGQLLNPTSTTICEYCPLTSSDQYLASVAIKWDERWRNYAIGYVYIFFNIGAAVGLYWAFRVKRWSPGVIRKWPGLVGHYVKAAALGVRVALVGHTRPCARVGTNEERRGKGNKVF